MTNLRRSYDEFMIIIMLIFWSSYDNFMILSCDKVMITNLTLDYDCLAKRKCKQTQMAHLSALVSNEKAKKK